MTVVVQDAKHSHREREINKTSILLSQDENQTVAALVGPRCVSLATTVAQVYRSEGPSHNYRWNKRTCGVVCFVKDNLRRSYFIRVYDMDRMLLVFDQEMYNQFRYKAPRPYFHTFEGDDSQIGLNFADETEASIFQQTIEAKVLERKQRRERKQASRKQHQSNLNNNGVTTLGVGNGVNVPVKNPSLSGTGSYPVINSAGNTTSLGGKKSDKRKIKKEDIGLPTNFQHISHVGWDPNHGFDLENVDPNLKKFFQKAGVDERALQDKDTRDFIYDFIDKHGGVEAALREVNSQEEINKIVPPPPPRATPLANHPSRPAPPSRAPPPPGQPRNTPSQKAPPPPAPVKASSAIPVCAPPPPPPPPPPPAAPSAPAPPQTLMSQMTERVKQPSTAPSSLPNIDTSRSNLMEEIRKGGSLRHVSPERTPKGASDTRCELMDQIRQGVSLKKVDSSNSEPEAGSVSTTTPGIAGMLQRALQERGVAMGLSSSEGEDSGDDEDDEWDD